MQIIIRTTIEVSYASGEGPLVHSERSYSKDGRYRIDSVTHETAIEPGRYGTQPLITVSVKGRRVNKDGTYPDRVQYSEPLYGDEVDRVAIEILESADATEKSK